MRLQRLTFLVFCVTPCLLMCACGVSTATDSAGVSVTVNPSSQHPISPYIYGINFASKVDGVPAGLTLDRSGGNRWTAYNWETNASNAGSDYLYQNDNSLGSSSEPGAGVSSLIAEDQKSGMASLVTFQLQGLVAGDTKGPVAVTSPPDKTRFKRVFYEKKTVTGEPFTSTPSVSDDYVYMDEFIWALDRKFAGQNIFGKQPSSQHVFADLDNEPELWKTTHLEVQGSTSISADDYIARTIALATALKRQFPDLVIFGPGNYGFLGVYNWNGELSTTASASNWFADRYLTALQAAATSFGKPLVDVYDFHWYPEATDGAGTRVTTLLKPNLTNDQIQAIVQSPRSLWDKTYRESSWIMNVIGQPIAILERLQSRIDAENPGTKLAITEYDNGGGQHIAGTIAQADNLGVFGAHGLFAATLWPLTPKEPYTLAGFRAYRNFDGAGHHFGDTSIEATSSNVANVAVYVSTDSTRKGRVVMVAINRSPSQQVTSVSGQPLSGAAHLFQMTAATAAKQSTIKPVPAGVQPVSGSSLNLTLPALSVTTVDIY
jgi:Glycoside hydrolase family 44